MATKVKEPLALGCSRMRQRSNGYFGKQIGNAIRRTSVLRPMEKRESYSLLLVFCIYMLTAINAQQPDPRFLVLSIDCGAASPYNDSTLGIEWQTDKNYISTGTSAQTKECTGLPKQLYSYRSFTSGRSKDCYTLKVNTDTIYLLRVRLFPGSGGSSSVALPVDFSVSVNSNHWFSYSAVSGKDSSEVLQESIFYSFQMEEVYLCLLKGERGAPFINSIELRILPKNSYLDTRSKQEPPNFLVLGDRLNMGAKSTDQPFRFPDDDFDRIWWPALPPKFPPYPRADGSSIFSNLTFFSYNPDLTYPTDIATNWAPNKTLIDAWANVNATKLGDNDNSEGIYEDIEDLWNYVNITNRIDQSAEIFPTIEGNVSGIINVNVSYFYGPFTKILLNGFEYYYLYEVDISATYSSDRDILESIKASFDLGDWKGDPCYPVAWDWVTCDSGSRIQTLNLTGMELSGPIPENISSLPELTEIYLDNNNLSGIIPESLASLTKLTILALDNNQLTGDIPTQLLNMLGLKLTFSGNPGLTRGGTKVSASPAPSPAASSAPVRSTLKSDVILYRTMLLLLSIWVLVPFR
ncbi:hypothetical protein R1flu_024486 [Riccia fluitans]|uniref:Malectin-like domain-containing protein n=1 Tax=Riccia fluitans TaxID=41844 RepID=A0ABD1XVH6_9MARC